MALIKAGADVNVKYKSGRMPITLFSQYNSSPEVIKALIEAGADVNTKTDFGNTPLILTAQHNPNPEVITMLLNLGANPKAKDRRGKMAIDYARENENLKNTEALRKLEEASKE
jgi:ankyrin repeat protein